MAKELCVYELYSKQIRNQSQPELSEIFRRKELVGLSI